MAESSRREEIYDSLRYLSGLIALVLFGSSLRIPVIPFLTAQLCFLICALHITWRCVKTGHWWIALLPIVMMVLVGLVDNIYFYILSPQ